LRRIREIDDWIKAFQGAAVEERTALLLGKRIEQLNLALMESVGNLVMLNILKWWEKRKELLLVRSPYNPCTCRTSPSFHKKKNNLFPETFLEKLPFLIDLLLLY